MTVIDELIELRAELVKQRGRSIFSLARIAMIAWQLWQISKPR
ncbi:hypothetical protein DSM110093_02341 [Sulfitobacter sp. DSM 110093]|nr:hypothetical protein [Sulfitobacter sp. DSM 110093]UOA32541.1 hypothetical protein DSM110093_02341 [Sulfitobacter sp. DSM 110093]